MNAKNKIMVRYFSFVLISLLIFSLRESRAESWPDIVPPLIGKGGEHDVALIVAIENYTDVPQVPGARKNAIAWEQYFKDTLGMQNVFVLLDKDAPHFMIEKKLKETVDKVKPEGRFWFVFIGHGAPSSDGSDGVLVGIKADSTADGLYAGSLPRSRVLEIIQNRNVPSILVLDACFSGSYGSSNQSIAKGLQPLIPVKMQSVSGQILILSPRDAQQGRR